MKRQSRKTLFFLLLIISAFAFIGCGESQQNSSPGSNSSNTLPVADAGPDQSVLTGSPVTLDGSGCSDGDGTQLTYLWSFLSTPAGSGASFSDNTAVNPSFTADIDGVYLVQLVVSDGISESPPDTINVIASTAALPTADAGSDISASTGNPVTLDGSGSSVGDGTQLTYL